MHLPPAIRPMLERLLYALYLALFVLSIGSVGLGGIHTAITGDFRVVALAAGGLALSRWLHIQGFAHWHFQQCADSLEMREAAGGIWPRSEEEADAAAEVRALLAQFESESEVWTRGELRRAISTRLDARPALRAEFAEDLGRHPEL